MSRGGRVAMVAASLLVIACVVAYSVSGELRGAIKLLLRGANDPLVCGPGDVMDVSGVTITLPAASKAWAVRASGSCKLDLGNARITASRGIWIGGRASVRLSGARVRTTGPALRVAGRGRLFVVWGTLARTSAPAGTKQRGARNAADAATVQLRDNAVVTMGHTRVHAATPRGTALAARDYSRVLLDGATTVGALVSMERSVVMLERPAHRGAVRAEGRSVLGVRGGKLAGVVHVGPAALRVDIPAGKDRNTVLREAIRNRR